MPYYTHHKFKGTNINVLKSHKSGVLTEWVDIPHRVRGPQRYVCAYVIQDDPYV